MKIEDQLKELILTRYKSIREFTMEIDIPYSTISSMFKSGIDKTSVGTIIKICKKLHISADALANGRIESVFFNGTHEGNDNEVFSKIKELGLDCKNLERLLEYAEFLKSKKI